MTNEYYEALVRRDAAYDGVFLYGVRTTGVYCRPVCKSRAPLERNVAFFPDVRAAQVAGFRACLRCKPDAAAGALDERFARVCQAIEGSEETPRLAELAALTGLSPSHLQRRFKAALGVSPRAYGEMVRQKRFRAQIREGRTVTEALYGAGFRSSAQFYGGGADALGMTPSRFRKGGEGETLAYAVVESALGRVLVAATERGVCRVDIGEVDGELEQRLGAEFPKARIRREDDRLQSATSLIVAYLSGEGAWPLLPLDVRATTFQMCVWDALRSIAAGSTATYAQLAAAIGSPRGARAVARACATNPVALLIPCHRIVPASGGVGGYRWQPARKERLLALERAPR